MTTVTHSIFGKGQVISRDENNVTVDFNGVVKTLVIKFSKLMNEDGTMFGDQTVAPKLKKTTASQKRVAFEKTLTEDQKRASFENADGSLNEDKYYAFLDEQNKKKWASKSW